MSETQEDNLLINDNQPELYHLDQLDKNKELSQNELLANCIWIFHVFIIIFVILGPLSPIPSILFLHIIFSISLMTHWYMNNDACSLTYMEAQLRGVEIKDSFSYKFIAPMYNISKTDWSNICYIITICAMCLSIYFLWNSPRIAEAKKCYKEVSQNISKNEYGFTQKFNLYMKCFRGLFI
jgi:hypothetical protein